MRIMHVIPGLAPEDGGVPEACLRLCRELALGGEDVSIYTTGDPNGMYPETDDIIRGSRVEIKRFPEVGRLKLTFSPSLAMALSRDIPKQDVVHIHSLYKFPSTIAAYFCRKRGVPYLVKPHGTLDPFIFRRHRLGKAVLERLFEWRNLERAAAVHFTSEGERDLVRPLGLNIKSVVVSTAVDLSEYPIEPLRGRFRDRWPETRGKKLILFLGRVNFKKGLDLLSQAFGRLARERDDLRLVIAGPDNEGYEKQVRQWLVNEGVLDRTIFTGMLIGQEKLDALADADCLVLPSYGENFGISVAEAMASSLAVVVSNRVNIWPHVAAAGAGVVVDCEVEPLAEAIAGVLDHRHASLEMGRRGRKLVEEKFTWKSVAQKMIEVYRDVVISAKTNRRSTARRIA